MPELDAPDPERLRAAGGAAEPGIGKDAAGPPPPPPPPNARRYPTSANVTQATAYRPAFFVRMSTVFLARTRPASSIVKPAAIHTTRVPHMRM